MDTLNVRKDRPEDSEILEELRGVAKEHNWRNFTIATRWVFKEYKPLLFLPKHDRFAKYILEIEADIDDKSMIKYGLEEYVNKGYLMFNPRVLGQQVTYIGCSYYMKQLTAVLDKYNIPYLTDEPHMTDQDYKRLIGWPFDLYWNANK